MSPVFRVLASIGKFGVVLFETIAYIPSVFLRRSGLVELSTQLYATGIRTLPVISVVAFFTGMILSLQGGLLLAKFNQEMFLGAAVMMTLVRDMAAFSCGICLAACVGSAIAAELGTMKVHDEIDALKIMDISPIRFLVAPRILALAMMAPLLTFYCCILGIVGGGLVGVTQLNINFGQFVAGAMNVIDVKDFYVGLIKSSVFGVLIGTISSVEGLNTELGATGVGKSTQRAVIESLLLILIIGYMLTRACY